MSTMIVLTPQMLDAGAKPRRVLSEEHRAAIKAGREAAKLKKQLVAAGANPEWLRRYYP